MAINVFQIITISGSAGVEQTLTFNDDNLLLNNYEPIFAAISLTNVNLKPINIPDFPVAGKDLIATGMKPGPEIGQTLAKLKQAWKDQKFIPSRDDLLKQLT